MVPGVGFYVITTCIVAVMVFDFMYMLLLKSMDSHFLLRCFLQCSLLQWQLTYFLAHTGFQYFMGMAIKQFCFAYIVKNLIQLPFNTVIAYYVVKYRQGVQIF